MPKETTGDATVSRALQKARDAHQKANQETARLQREVETVNEKIAADHGPDDVFRAIKDDCASLDAGEYTYTVCIMGQVTQKSNKDSANTNLGYPPLPNSLTNVVLSRDLKMITRQWSMREAPNVGMALKDQLESNWNAAQRT